MKKVTLKGMSIVLAALLSFSALPIGTASADAEIVADYDMTWTLRESETRSDTVYVSREDLAQGNQKVNVSFFIETENSAPEDLNFISASMSCVNADEIATKYMRIEKPTSASDLAEMAEQLDQASVSDDFPAEDLNSDGTIKTWNDEILEGVLVKYIPTCLTSIVTRGGQTYTTSGWFNAASDTIHVMADCPHTEDACHVGCKYFGIHEEVICPNGGGCDNLPVEEVVYSAGPYQVKIYHPYKDQEFIFDVVDYDEVTGIAYFDMGEYNSRNGVVYSKMVKIENYDPTVPDGEAIVNYSEYRNFWMFNGKTNSKTSWLGEKSDAFPLTTFDVTISSDTPDGTYYVSFDPETDEKNNYMSSGAITYIPQNLLSTREVNDQSCWLKIVVGDGEAPEVAGDVTGDGIVDLRDVSGILSIYAQSAASGATTETLLLQSSAATDAADVNKDGVVDIRDAKEALNRYAANAAGIA